MKILKSFLVAFALFALTACSDDDTEPVVALTIENFAGTYEVVFLEEESVTTDDSTGVVVRTTSTEADTFANAIFVFNSDGTYSSSGNYRTTTVIRVTNEPSETETDIEEFDSSGSYTLNSESRTISIDGIIVDVSRFNGTNLTLKFVDSESDDGNTTVFESETRLVKQS